MTEKEYQKWYYENITKPKRKFKKAKKLKFIACIECGKRFKPMRSNRLLCSSECREKANHKHAMARNLRLRLDRNKKTS